MIQQLENTIICKQIFKDYKWGNYEWKRKGNKGILIGVFHTM